MRLFILALGGLVLGVFLGYHFWGAANAPLQILSLSVAALIVIALDTKEPL